MPFSTYLPERMGSAVIEPAGALEAGSYASLTITCTAGHFGVDDTGALELSWRTASDAGKPQLHDPAGASCTTVEASNGARHRAHILIRQAARRPAATGTERR